jgi:hypothetical protein
MKWIFFVKKSVNLNSIFYIFKHIIYHHAGLHGVKT